MNDERRGEGKRKLVNQFLLNSPSYPIINNKAFEQASSSNQRTSQSGNPFLLLPQTMGKWPLELVQTTVLHHPQPLPCHHGRQSSSTSAELSQYLPTSPRHSRQNSSCKSPPIPPRRPYIMTSPSSNPMTVAPPTLLKLSPNSIGKKTRKTVSLYQNSDFTDFTFFPVKSVCLFIYVSNTGVL